MDSSSEIDESKQDDDNSGEVSLSKNKTAKYSIK
jgi:hypothetical protein